MPTIADCLPCPKTVLIVSTYTKSWTWHWPCQWHGFLSSFYRWGNGGLEKLRCLSWSTPGRRSRAWIWIYMTNSRSPTFNYLGMWKKMTFFRTAFKDNCVNMMGSRVVAYTGKIFPSIKTRHCLPGPLASLPFSPPSFPHPSPTSLPSLCPSPG